MTPNRRVTDRPHGPDMVQLALDDLLARFPVAFRARDVQPVSARAISVRVTCWDCNQPAVVVAAHGSGRVALCFPHAETLLGVGHETTRDRSEHTAARS